MARELLHRLAAAPDMAAGTAAVCTFLTEQEAEMGREDRRCVPETAQENPRPPSAHVHPEP